jgi:hypothetical protein
MNSLRILITNNTLDQRAGSELYVRDLALALLKRGHQPVAYSPRHGTVAAELRAATVPVIDNLDALAVAPDVIHGQHHLETMTALLRFPRTPALHYCHGWLPWEETPLRHPRILRYVAVDRLCRERLISESGIPPDRTVELLNFVDLERFQPRAALPSRPQSALFFNNNITENAQLQAVRYACEQAGITLTTMGAAHGTASPQPENELGKYDLVFAKARCALEALALGNAVILCDPTTPMGLGELVTLAGLDRLRSLNFGVRVINQPLTAASLLREIQRYDAADAQRVSAQIRATASLDDTVETLLALYRELRAEYAASPTNDKEAAQAEAAYLRWLSMRVGERHQLAFSLHQAQVELAQARHEAALWQAEKQQLQLASETAALQCENWQRQAEQASNERQQVQSHFDSWQNSRAGRLITWLQRLQSD